MSRVTIERGIATRRRVPYVMAVPSSSTPRGVVVMVHGLWEDAESLLPHALRFARSGMIAVAIDARDHGVRRGSWQTLGRRGLRERGARYFMNLAARLAFETGLDVAAVTAWLRRERPAVAEPVALWGNSLGCNAVLIATPMVRPVAVAAAMGHADWDGAWRRSWPYFHPGTPAAPPDWSTHVARLIEAHEPIRHRREFWPAKLLLVGGRDDHPMIEGMRALHAALLPHYQVDHAHLRLDEVRGGHQFSRAVAGKMHDWIAVVMKDACR